MSHRDSKSAVVFGSAGQLGVELMRVFRGRGYQVQGFDRDVIDICDAAAVEAVLAQADPALVINAAAYNMVDVAEREPAAAFQANALAVRNVAMACRQVDAQLVHYSTDYVFDGTAGRPYTEQDKPHPLGAYAVSKYAGELYAEAYLESPLIVRTSGLFGPGGLHTARGNFIELMLRLAGGSQPIRVVEDHVASPAYAPALAERTAQLVERNAVGVFHVGGGRPISWFEFARLIFRVAGVSPVLRSTSEREYRTEAKRPKFSALSNAKMEAFGIAPMPPMEEAVADYFERRKEHVARQAVS
ncbi:MAG: dTDP-4-dehydrorhamnose reductase [Bryobacteraceae bacterium]|jgi:dTDP-4-dehydrorhamnose reductase